MSNTAILVSLLFLMTTGPVHAQEDSSSFRAAVAIADAPGKIRALEEFAAQYPGSKLLVKAYDALFELYLDQMNEPAALTAAARSIATVRPDGRSGPYNRFAYSLASRNLGLDTALVYVDRAEELARQANPRTLPMIQDTKAYVLFRRGRSLEAEELQRVAIRGNEDDPEYLAHLALYEKENGNLRDGLHTLARALYFGAGEDSRGDFLRWIREAGLGDAEQQALKDSVVMAEIHGTTDTLRGAAQIQALSNASAMMADLGVDLLRAHKWAEAGVASLRAASPVDDRVSFTRNLAVVLAAQGRPAESLKHLNSIEDLADPYDVHFWKLLGTTRLLEGDTAGAMDACLRGLLPTNDKQLRDDVETLYRRRSPSPGDIDRLLDSLREAGADFDPGRYHAAGTSTGKVILAELFTGAECGPCAGSDLAFDALSRYYPRSAVAILEYHVHIPGPDPMTTNDSWDRYTWYSGQGTPTVVFDGGTPMLGGGARWTAGNRFHVYHYAINQAESIAPGARLALDVEERGDSVTVRATVLPAGSRSDTGKPVVHVALVERSVAYTGANGIPLHAFVVRWLAGGAAGTRLSWSAGGETVTNVISLAGVERTIREYLDNPLVQPSWPKRRTTFAGWRARPEHLDRSNLAVVAWVQDATTKEVLQSAYREVPSGPESR